MLPSAYQALMNPSAVAVIGASDDPSKISGRPLSYLKKYGFAGRIIPVNSRREFVQGLRSHRSVDEIDGSVDLAVVLTPAEGVPDLVEALVEAEVPTVAVISSGFAERDDAGADLQARLSKLVEGTDTRILGPNCLGVISAPARLVTTINTGMNQDRWQLRDGGITLLTQSGAIGSFLLNMAQTQRVGVGSLISTGNEMDLSFGELLEALLDDPGVKGVLGYIEGIRDGHTFVRALAHAADLGKPVAFLKVGHTAHGQDAIASHTGALAGDDALYSGVFEQFGAARLVGIEEMVDWAQLIDTTPSAIGPRISVVTTSGGGGVMVSDACTDLGLLLASWEGVWADRLAELLPAYLSARNPIDMGGAAGEPESLARALALMAEHPETDVRFVFIGNLEAEEDALIGVLDEARRLSDKPLVVVWVGGSGRPARVLTERGIPTLPDPLRALRAIAARMSPARTIARHSWAGSVDRDRRAAARRIIADARAERLRLLDAERAHELLTLYGLPIVREAVASDPSHAAEVAAAVGFPVALKILAPNVVHKTERGGVELDLASPEAVREAAAAMVGRLDPETARASRFVVQEMVTPGLEILLGLKRDPTYGSVVLVGLGGIWAEMLEDVQLRVPPLDRRQAEDAVDGLRAARVLDGFRGSVPDRPAIIDAILAVSSIAEELGDEVAGLDLNPLIVHQRGQGARIVDSVILPAEVPDRATHSPEQARGA